MNLLVFGGNGRTGRQLLARALPAGHRVTALVRRAESLSDLRHAGLRVHEGDVRDPAAWTSLLRDTDAVVSMLGPRWPTRRAAAIYDEAAKVFVPALERAGVRRLLVTSSGLLFPPERRSARWLRRLVPAIVEHAARMEDIIVGSELNWTIARTTFLTNGPDDLPRVTAGRLPIDERPVARAAVANYLLDAALHDCHAGQIVGICA